MCGRHDLSGISNGLSVLNPGEPGMAVITLTHEMIGYCGSKIIYWPMIGLPVETRRSA